MSHIYEVSYPKVELARAKNKCRSCGRAILRDEKYLMFWYIDTCTHRTTSYSRSSGFHKQMKLCKGCMGQALHPRMEDGRVLLKPKHEERCREILRKILGVNRYDIVRGIDPVDRLLAKH